MNQTHGKTPRAIAPQHAPAALMTLAVAFIVATPAARADAPVAGEQPRGVKIYLDQCASCHGDKGQGVRGEYSDPLIGDRSVAQLARYITKWMPEEDPDLCVGEDAKAVAAYIHDAFYSPLAQERNRPARVELSRLTVDRYRHAVSDLVGSFRKDEPRHEGNGLKAEYFNDRNVGRNRVVERIDPQLAVHFGQDNPAPDKLGDGPLSARWRGAVVAPSTGRYTITVRTNHAFKLWLNNDDEPLIDAWVKSGDQTDYQASIELTGGRAYPVKLEFTAGHVGVDNRIKGEDDPRKAYVELRWKPPGRAERIVPAWRLIPHDAPERFVVTTPFPPDDRSVGYERGTRISKAWNQSITDAAIETANYVVAHLDELAEFKRRDEDKADEKARAFARTFVERAFRRPLTDAERTLYVDRQFEQAPHHELAVKRVVMLALTSPRFLYVDGSAEPGDAYAVASRLSFALWDSLPDRKLLEAAAKNELATREQVAAQARRMLDDPRAYAKARRFLHQWLHVEEHPDLSKDEAVYPGFDEQLSDDLRVSLDMFLDDVLRSDTADFRRLIQGEELWMNGRLAKFYGIDLPEDAGFTKVPADHPERKGVLAHPYVMSNLAYTATTSPIHRGVFVVRSVLGRALRPPPVAVAPDSPELHPDLTTRQRVSVQTADRTCQSCHAMINNTGFTLEHFDAVGRFRETDNGKPVDATGWYELADGAKQDFANARDMAEFLAESPQVHRAFLVQLFHHMVKQPVMAYGQQTPDALRDAFVKDGYGIRALMADIAVTAALPEPADAGKKAADEARGDTALAARPDAPHTKQ